MKPTHRRSTNAVDHMELLTSRCLTPPLASGVEVVPIASASAFRPSSPRSCAPGPATRGAASAISAPRCWPAGLKTPGRTPEAAIAAVVRYGWDTAEVRRGHQRPTGRRPAAMGSCTLPLHGCTARLHHSSHPPPRLTPGLFAFRARACRCRPHRRCAGRGQGGPGPDSAPAVDRAAARPSPRGRAGCCGRRGWRGSAHRA